MQKTIEPETKPPPQLSRIRPGYWRALWDASLEPTVCPDLSLAAGFTPWGKDLWLDPDKHPTAEICEHKALIDEKSIPENKCRFVQPIHFNEGE